MQPLPPELLPAVPHVAFGVFDLALPNIVAWACIVLGLPLAAWARLPRFLEPADEVEA